MRNWRDLIKDPNIQTRVLQVTAFVMILFFSEIVSERTGERKLQDYKPLLQKFSDLKFKDIEYNRWIEIDEDCKRFNQTRHSTLLRFESIGDETLMLTMVRDPGWGIFITKLENYSKSIDEGFSSEVDNNYVEKSIFDEIHKYTSSFSSEHAKKIVLATHWKNLVIDNKCYHLLVEVSPFDGPDSTIPYEF